MVVHGNCESLFSARLTDHILIKNIIDLLRLRQPVDIRTFRLFQPLLFADNIVAEFNTLIADVDRWTGNQLLNLFLPLAAERADKCICSIVTLAHAAPPLTGLRIRILSTRPYAQASALDMK